MRCQLFGYVGNIRHRLDLCMTDMYVIVSLTPETAFVLVFFA